MTDRGEPLEEAPLLGGDLGLVQLHWHWDWLAFPPSYPCVVVAVSFHLATIMFPHVPHLFQLEPSP